jgi:hypothetical protein
MKKTDILKLAAHQAKPFRQKFVRDVESTLSLQKMTECEREVYITSLRGHIDQELGQAVRMLLHRHVS